MHAQAGLPPELLAGLKATPRPYRRELANLWQMTQLLQREKVMMTMPIGLVED
jgi:hypothetical protein